MKRMITLLFVTLASLGTMALASPVPVLADAKSEICKGVNAAANGACANGATALNKTISTIVNILSVIIGIVAVFMIMVAGFKYITSGGDSGNIASAKNTLVYAIVGLVVAALAQFIVKFVLSKTA